MTKLTNFVSYEINLINPFLVQVRTEKEGEEEGTFLRRKS